MLRDVRPRGRVRDDGAGGHLERHRRRSCDDRAAATDVHGEVREPARRGEVERVLLAVGAVRIEGEIDRIGRSGVGDRDRAARDLQQRGHPLARARRIRDHDEARVDDAGLQRAKDVLRDLLAVDPAHAVIGAHVALADDQWRTAPGELADRDLRRPDERVARGGDRERRPLGRDRVWRRHERQVDHGERAHRLGEAARRDAEPRRQERAALVRASLARIDSAGSSPGRSARREVPPVVLRPLLRLVGGAEHRRLGAAALEVAFENDPRRASPSSVRASPRAAARRWPPPVRTRRSCRRARSRRRTPLPESSRAWRRHRASTRQAAYRSAASRGQDPAAAPRPDRRAGAPARARRRAAARAAHARRR